MPMETKPSYIVNFKAYEQGTGALALELARKIEEFAEKTGADIGIAVQPMDIELLATNVELPIFAQHIDPASFGSHTGSILPESVIGAGAVGTLLNHSERRIDFDVLKKSIVRAKETGLQVIVCVADTKEAKTVANFDEKPDFIAIEPPELIGGDISVSTAKPEVISDGVKVVGDVPLLVGAGVKTFADVEIAVKLGAVGVLLASGVVKADDVLTALENLTGEKLE